MQPRDEIVRTGCIGESGARLLYRTVAAVAVGRNFPPPEGSSRWDRTAVTETAHDFLHGERGSKRVTDIAIRSMDDLGFERLLEAAVVNFLREGSRRTDLGKLILRVTELLREEDAFHQVSSSPARWALAGRGCDPSAAPVSTLVAAVAQVPVVIPTWRSARRDAPLADRPSFRRLLVAALTAARGSLTATDLAHVIATRLDHRRTALTLELDVLERLAEPATASDPAISAVSGLRATELFDHLDDRERILVATPDATVRTLGPLLALGRSQAAHLRQRLHDRLRAELADDDEPAATLNALGELCDIWLWERTEPPGASFDRADERDGRFQDDLA